MAKALQGLAPTVPHSGSEVRRVEASASALAPSESKLRDTTQPTPFCGSTASAPVTLVPWMKAGSRLYFAAPLTSQVPSHLSGLSGRPPVKLIGSVQSRASICAWNSGVLLSAWMRGAAVGVTDEDALADGSGLAPAEAAGEADDVAPAEASGEGLGDGLGEAGASAVAMGL